MSTDIDTRDHVFHIPTGETWVVAYVQGKRLAWCGWPEGEAALADCTLVHKATEVQRAALLESMARGVGKRAAYAKARLKAEMEREG
jgi:hypothetical protein